MSKKVLLTGIGGFVGSHILDHILVNTDWEVIGVASWKHKGVPERILHSKHYKKHKDRVTLVTHDLISPFSNLTAAWFDGINYIINVASESHVDRSIDEPASFIRNNIELMLTMLEFARTEPIEAFIQFSTDEVYGPALGKKLSKEWDPHIPSNPYSASKAAQEDIAISYWRTYRVPLIITNTMNVLGERQNPEKYLPRIIRALKEQTTLNVHGEKDAISSRFYIHARNVADALLFILSKGKPASYPDAQVPDRYNIVGEKELNNLELARLVSKLMGKDLIYRLIEVHSQRPGHDRRYALDGGKLAKLGWKRPLTLNASIKNILKWYEENLDWL